MVPLQRVSFFKSFFVVYRAGNPIYLKDPIGAEWRFFYDLNGNLFAHQEPNGRGIVNFYDGKNQIIQTFFSASLDLDGSDTFARYKGFRSEGGYTIFRYDQVTGGLISRENKKEAKTTFTYHKNGEQKGIISPTGYRIEREIDEKGRLFEISDEYGIQKSYDYDEYDRIKAIRTAAGPTYFTYDDDGDLKMVLDPRGFATSYDYDTQHNLRGVTDAEGGNTSYEYNSLNQLNHVSLPNGSCKTIRYDSFGRLEQEIWGK